MGYLYIALTIACTVYGQLILKYEMNIVQSVAHNYSTVSFYLHFLLRPLVISGFVSAFFASLFWIAALSKFELSYAYPLTSMNFVLVLCLSAVFFGETIDIYKIMGVLAICTGLVILGVGAR